MGLRMELQAQKQKLQELQAELECPGNVRLQKLQEENTRLQHELQHSRMMLAQQCSAEVDEWHPGLHPYSFESENLLPHTTVNDSWSVSLASPAFPAGTNENLSSPRLPVLDSVGMTGVKERPPHEENRPMKVATPAVSVVEPHLARSGLAVNVPAGNDQLPIQVSKPSSRRRRNSSDCIVGDSVDNIAWAPSSPAGHATPCWTSLPAGITPSKSASIIDAIISPRSHVQHCSASVN